MQKDEIKIGQNLYYNTTGAYQKPISLYCEVLDIGEKYIWIMINYNLSPTPVKAEELSIVPINEVTNKK